MIHYWTYHFRYVEIILCLACIILGAIIIQNISFIFCAVAIVGGIFFICSIWNLCRLINDKEDLLSFNLWVICASLAQGIFFVVSGYLYLASIFYDFPLIMIFTHAAVTTSAVVFLLDLIFIIWPSADYNKYVDVEDTTTQTRRQIPPEESESERRMAIDEVIHQSCRRDTILKPGPETIYKCDYCRRNREEKLYQCDDNVCPDKIDKATQFEKEYLPDEFCRGECETCDDKKICDKRICYPDEEEKDIFTFSLKIDKSTQFNTECDPPEMPLSHEDLLTPKPNEMCILECEDHEDYLPNKKSKTVQISTFKILRNTCDESYCCPKYGQTIATQCDLDNMNIKSSSSIPGELEIKPDLRRKFRCNKIYPEETINKDEKQTQVSNIKECINPKCGKHLKTSEKFTETDDVCSLFRCHPPPIIKKTVDNSTQMSKTQVAPKITRSEITQTSFEKMNTCPQEKCFPYTSREIQTSSHLMHGVRNGNSIRINPEKSPVTIVVEYDSVPEFENEKEIQDIHFSQSTCNTQRDDLCKNSYHHDDLCKQRCCRCYNPPRKRLGIKVGQYKENEIKHLGSQTSVPRQCSSEKETNQGIETMPYKSKRNGLDTPEGNRSNRILNQDSPLVRQASPIFRYVTPSNSRNTSPEIMEISPMVSERKLPASDPNSITFNR